MKRFFNSLQEFDREYIKWVFQRRKEMTEEEKAGLGEFDRAMEENEKCKCNEELENLIKTINEYMRNVNGENFEKMMDEVEKLEIKYKIGESSN